MIRELICYWTGGHWYALHDLMGVRHCLVCHRLCNQEGQMS